MNLIEAMTDRRGGIRNIFPPQDKYDRPYVVISVSLWMVRFLRWLKFNVEE